jgi:hypothetical protein
MVTDPVIVSVKSIYLFVDELKFQGPSSILPNNIYGVTTVDTGIGTSLLIVAICVEGSDSCVTLVIFIVPPALEVANITL